MAHGLLCGRKCLATRRAGVQTIVSDPSYAPPALGNSLSSFTTSAGRFFLFCFTHHSFLEIVEIQNTMNYIKYMALPLVVLTGFGCANLQPIRDYSKAASVTVNDTTARSTIIKYSARASSFAKPFGTVDVDVAEAKALALDIENIEKLCAKYLTTMGTLAGADFATLDAEISGLASSIKAFPDSGIKAESVDAYAALLKALSNAVLAAYQQRKVRELIDAGGSHFVELVATLVRVSESSEAAISLQSRVIVGSVPDLLVAEAKKNNTLVARVAHDWVQQNQEQLAKDLKAREAARTALREVQAGHQKLTAQMNQFDAVATATVLRPHIEAIYKALVVIRENK